MRIKSIITSFLLILSGWASAQKVGVVMSGGGAKGLYHIGVLKALEENEIPFDYISGTSLGSIVAGLYAIGYTPDELAEVIKSDQISYWMSGRIQPQYNYYFRQKQPNAAMLTLRLDLKNPKTYRRNAGFTDEERQKFTELLDAGFIDTFRYFYPDRKDIYSWWSYRFKAREKTAGWRIDYFLASASLNEKLCSAKIHTEIFGSDHCPVG